MKKFFSVETTENLINAELGLLPTQNDTAIEAVLFAQIDASAGAQIDPGAVNVVLDENAVVEDGFIIIDGVAIPADIAEGEVEEIEPEAAPVALSGGGSAQPFDLGDIGPNIDITDLLPPTALLFTIPEEEELDPFADPNDVPDVEVVPDDPIDPAVVGPTIEPIDAVADETALPGGSDEGSGGDVTTGDLVVDTGNDALASLVINGIDVTNGGTITGTYGTLTITVNPDGTYDYSYVLTDNTIDHPDTGSVGTTEGISDGFTVVATDEDGDTATESLVIGILDDGPIAVVDTATQDQEDAPVSVDVFDNDSEGADGVNADTGLEIVADSVSGDGTLVDNGDGTVTYTPAPGEEGDITFEYIITDGDGDTSTAVGTITLLDDSEPVLGIVPVSSTVEESALDADGSNPASDAEATSGELSFDTGNDTLESLIIDGVDVTNGGTVTGEFGVLTVTVTNGTYTYDYILSDSTDAHANGPVAEDFEIVVTDSDGDTASDTLVIDIVDDIPTANDDSAAQMGENTPVTVDVFDNDVEGADGVNADAGVTVVPNTLSGGGDLVDNGDGSFTYTPAPGEEGDVTFNYEITDADGDTSIATVTISLEDDSTPTVEVVPETPSELDGSTADSSVDEAALDTPDATGSEPALATEMTAGDFAIDTGNDTIGTLVVGDVDVTNGGTVTGQYGELEVTLNPDGTYSWEYTITDNTTAHDVVNAEEGVQDIFTVVVTDSDGDTADTTLTVDVIDDAPSAEDDSNTATEGGVAVEGNVLDNDTVGADSDTIGTDSVVTLDSAAMGSFGTLTLNADGTYSYTPNASVPEGSTDSFDYTITDADGDTATATLTITFDGDNNVPTATADASVLSDVSGDDNADGSNADAFVPVSDTGDLNIDFGLDGAGTFGTTYDGGLGAATTTSAAGSTTILADDGSWTLVINETTGAYTFTQNTAYDHEVGADSDVAIVTVNITDGDGSPVSVDINLTINDDVPVANNDTNGATEGAANVSTGNVLDNDDIGADHGVVGTDSIATLVGDGMGSHGTLVLNANGEYTYTPNASVDEDSVDTFTYTVTDADGDTDTATLEFTFTGDINEPTAGVVTALADEDDLEGGNNDMQAGDNDPSDLTGILTHDYGVDGAGSITLLGGNETINGVDYTYTVGTDLNGDQVITANDGSQDVFTLTLTDDVAGTYVVELLAPVTHLGSDDPAFEDNLLFNLGYQVEDSDGSTVDGSFELTIDDDIPLATGEDAMTAEDLPVDIDITDNIMEGADGVDLVNDVTFDTTGTAGTVIYNDDGTFTFTPTPGFEGETSFTYTIVDGDGDAATATITIAVAGDSEPTVTVTDLTVNEDGLANGTEAATDSETDASGVMTIETGADSLTQVEIQDANGIWIDVTAATVGTPVTVNGEDGILTVTSDGAGNYAYSYTLTSNDDHPDTITTDGDGISDADDAIPGDSFAVRVSDNDGDTSTDTPGDAGTINVTVLDDAPIATLELEAGASLIIDESISQNAGEIEGGAAGLGQATIAATDLFSDSSEFGADGAAATDSTIYSLNVTSGTDTGLVDVATGESIVLVDAAGTIEGRSETTNELVFTLDVATDGSVTVTQLRALEHDDALDADEATSPEILGAGFVELEVQITDGDGDVATASVDLGGVIAFEDDGPSADTSGAVPVVAALDESDGTGSGMDGISPALIDAAAVAGLFEAPEFGADGAGSVDYALSATDGALTGLFLTGQSAAADEIVLDVVSDTQVNGVAGDGTIAFTITMAGDGAITVTQLETLEHTTDGELAAGGTHAGSAHDDILSLTGAISVEQTVTDADGDTSTATADGGLTVTFEDDGPVFTYPPTGTANLLVDEDFIPNTGNMDGMTVAGDTTGGVVDYGTAILDFGADGPADNEINIEIVHFGTSFINGAPALTELTSGGIPLVFDWDETTNVFTATAGDPGPTVFTLEANTTTGEFEFNLVGQLDHPLSNDLNASNGIESSYEDSIGIWFDVTITDGDGDTSTAQLRVNINDDSPEIDVVSTDEGDASLLTQDADTETGTDTDISTADFANVFSIDSSSYGADGPGSTTDLAYALNLAVSEGTDSGMTSGGSAINLFTVAGVIYGSTTANAADAVSEAVFSINVDGNGQVTLSQFEAIDHADGGPNPDYDTQVETLADGLVELTASATITDFDGDAITDSESIDLGGNIAFADDGPIANNDDDTAQEDGAAIMGTVMTNDDVGADEGAFGTDSFVTLTSSATGTYGTLTLDTDGSYTYTPFANTSVPAGSTDIFTYNLTDSDGDSDPATLTITFEGDAYGPTASGASATTSDVPGDDSITGSNTDAFTPQSTGGSLSFDFGLDGANTVSSFSTSYDGGLGIATTTSAAGITTIAADDGSWTAEINETTGAYTFTQNTAYDHDTGASTDSAVVQVTITDSDGSIATVNLNLSIDDDVPTAYAPTTTTTANDGTGTDTGDLNLDLGADLAGTATFINGTDGDPLTGSIDGGASQTLTSGGDPISLSGYGTNVLTATADGDTVFVATLNVDTDDYTIEWFDTIDNGASVDFTGLGFTQAGNPRFQMTDGPQNDNGDSQDLLFSTFENGDQTQAGTVNTDNSDVSVNNQGAGTEDGEGIRIDFVLNGSVQGQNNKAEYEYDAHFNANGFSFTIAEVGNTGSTDAVVRVYDADDDDPAPAGSGTPTDHSNNLSDDNGSQDTITEIRVNNEILDLIGGTPSSDGIVVSTDSNGDYVINNLEPGDIVAVSSADGYNRIEIENHAEGSNIDKGDGFSIRNFELRTENQGGDVNFNLDVNATDADSDSITSSIEVNLTNGTPDAAQQVKFTAPETQDDMSQLFIAANDMVDDFGFDASALARESMNSGFNGMAVLLGGMAMATEANAFDNIFEALQPTFDTNDFVSLNSDIAAIDFDNMIEMAFESFGGLNDLQTGQEAGFDASAFASASPFTGNDLDAGDLLGSTFEAVEAGMEAISIPGIGSTELAPATFEAGFGMPDLDLAGQFFADTELEDLLAQMPGVAADGTLATDNIEEINVDAGTDITTGIDLGSLELGGSEGLLSNGLDQGQTLQGLDDFHILAVANSIAVL